MCRTLRLPEEGRLLAEVKKPGTAECAEKHAEFAEVLIAAGVGGLVVRYSQVS
jgi:hypothetical protein